MEGNQILLWVVLVVAGGSFAYRFVYSKLGKRKQLASVPIAGFETSMGHKKTLNVSSLEDFILYYKELADSLGQLGLWEAERSIRDSVESFEAPMGGYYQRMATITTEILKQWKSELPSSLKRELEIGYNTCAKQCGIEGYAA